MTDKLWFGHARGHMQHVPCPLIDSSVTRNRYVERIQFENGGGDGRRSNQYQMQYDFAFSGLAHEVDGIDAFNKFAQGFYGDDLIYLAHPATFETNMFPAGWATPSLSENGWGKISSDAVAYADADGPSVTNLVTNPSMEAVASGTDSTKRVNLVTNPSFETDTTGWSVFGSATLARNTTEKYIGSASLQITATAIDGGTNRGSASSVTAGTTYTASAYLKGEATKLFRIRLDWRDSGGVSLSTSTTDATATGTWDRVSISAAAPTNAVSVNILLTNRTAGAHTFYADAVMLEQAPDLRPYFDGNYSEDPAYIPEWNGTVNNSTSDALVRGVSNRENLVTNPSFEIDLTGWSAPNAASTNTRITTDFYTGSACQKIAATAIYGGTYTGVLASTFPQFSTVTASAWVKGEVGKLLSIRVYGYDSAGVALEGFTDSTPIVMTGSWQRISVTRTMVSSASVRTRMLVWNMSNSAHTYFVDATMVEVSPSLNPYFDGGYTDMPGWTTSWAGTANASRSVATAAPVTVRTNLVTNPSMESVTAGSVVMRRNLVTNPSFETNTTGWSGTGSPAATLTRVNTDAYVGSWSMQVVCDGTVISQGAYTSNQSVVSANTTYMASVWVKATAGTSIRIELGEWAGASLIGRTNGATTAASGSWQRLSVSRSMGATATLADIVIRNINAVANTMNVDAVLLEASSTTGDYFDGNTTDYLGWDYAWSGTANASISTAASAATTVRTNLCTNPSFETGTTGWSANQASAYVTSTAQSYSGTQSLLVTHNAVSSSGAYFGTTRITVTAGTTYTWSAYVRDINTNVQFSARIEWYDASTGGTRLSISSGTATTINSSGWTRLSVTATAPTGAVAATTTVFSVTAPVAGTQSYVDAALLEASSTLGDFFDGSFNPAGDFSYAWTGTANASTSIQRGATVVGTVDLFNNSAGYQSSAWALTGSKSVRITPITANGDTFVSPGGDVGALRLGMVAGTTYTVSGTIRLAAAQTGTPVGDARKIVVYTRVGAGAYVPTGSTQAPNAAGTTRLSLTFTIPAGATEAFIRLYNGATAGNGDVWWDAVMLETAPIVQDYFDGSIVSADADLTNSWSGTAHASTSVMRGVQVATTAGANAYASAIQSGSWKSTGLDSIRIIPTATQPDSFAGITLPVASTMAGKTYTIMAKIRLQAPLAGSLDNRALKFFGQVNLSGGGTQQVGAATAASNVAGEQTYRSTFTVPATATTWSFARIYNGASAGNGNVWWDDLLVVEGTYTGDYFDGSSTDSGNTTYAWTGTANASTSTMLSEMVLYGNPRRAATYTVTNINVPPTKVCTLVIPPTHTLYLGASGTSTGSAGVFIRPIQASDSLYYGPLEELTLLDPNGSIRMNKTLDGATYQAVEIFLMKTDTNVGTVTLNSLMAQLYTTGTTPALPSNHYQGEGSTGLMFADDAIVETYSYMHPPRKGIATKLIEVEAWR